MFFGFPSPLVTTYNCFFLPPPSHVNVTFVLKRFNKLATYMCFVFISLFCLYKCIFVLRPRYAKQCSLAYILSILNFVVLLDSGPSIYIQLKSTVSPSQFDLNTSWWIKQEAYCIRKMISLNWLHFYLFSAKSVDA